MHPKRFLLIERDEGIKKDYGSVGRGICEGLRWGERRGGKSSVFLNGRVGESEGGLDVKREEGHVDIGGGGGWEGKG